MATVTIGKSYFEALVRRAQFHTSICEEDLGVDLCSHVIISKAEHEFLTQAVREYRLLQSALFRGGLTTETLKTLLAGESETLNEEKSQYVYSHDEKVAPLQKIPVSMETLTPDDDTSEGSTVSNLVQPRHHSRSHETFTYEEDSGGLSPQGEDHEHSPSTSSRVPFHDQRTLLVSNLAERTTHKDLVDVIRGGKLLDVYLRNDRTACVSFVEGASEFLAYTKRHDVYLHMKRLDFRWADRQFHVPSHVSNKIAGGATRNLVIRGLKGKITSDQIRDHLDHIHNLVVVDISFRNEDAYVSTNSIHNALFARTCLMSRTAYKGSRIEYYPDICATPLSTPQPKPRRLVPQAMAKPAPIVNQYALLDTGSDIDSDPDVDSYAIDGMGIGGCKLTSLATA